MNHLSNIETIQYMNDIFDNLSDAVTRLLSGINGYDQLTWNGKREYAVCNDPIKNFTLLPGHLPTFSDYFLCECISDFDLNTPEKVLEYVKNNILCLYKMAEKERADALRLAACNISLYKKPIEFKDIRLARGWYLCKEIDRTTKEEIRKFVTFYENNGIANHHSSFTYAGPLDIDQMAEAFEMYLEN